MFDVAIDNAFAFGSAEYAGLFGASAATAFQSPLWLARFYATLAARGAAAPLVVVVRRRADRQLVMVLPLVGRRYGPVRLVEFADLGVSDYAAPVATPADFTAIAADPSARRAIRQALRPYDLLRIQKLPASGLPLHDLLGARPPLPMGTSAYAVPLRGTYEEWRGQSLGASYRKELDKKARQLERRGVVVFERASDPAVIASAFARMREFRRLRFAGRPGTELLGLDLYYGFYLSVALEGRAGAARTYVLSVDGVPVAVAFGLAHDDRFLVLLSGFDHAGYKNVSLGALLFERVARACIASGDRLLDFTIGDEPYKLTFGGVPSPMSGIALAGSPLGWIADRMVGQVPWARALLRRLLQRPRRPPPAGASPDRLAAEPSAPASGS